MKNYALSYEEYMILVEQAPIMIWRSDTTMGCDYFNQKWLEFTGRTLEQERGNGKGKPACHGAPLSGIITPRTACQRRTPFSATPAGTPPAA